MDFLRNLRGKLKSILKSEYGTIAMVYSTLLLDNMLMTAVVPVLPEYFFTKHLDMEMKLASTTPPLVEQSTALYLYNTNTTDAVINTSSGQQGCNLTPQDKYLGAEALYIGILFASKPLVQMIANAAVGPLSDRIGFDIPMFVGYVVICGSAVLFAFGTDYTVLLLARAIQGVGSASASTAGMGMVADRFVDDEKRGRAIGLALGGLAMGVLIGPVFGSVMYQLAGKESIFLVLAFLAVVLALIQLFVCGLNIHRRPPGKEGSSLLKLLRDPYILIAALSIMLGNMCIGMLETGQPTWMIKTMCSPKWALGVAFLPESTSYLVVTNIVALCCQKWPRWVICLIGFYVATVGSATLPFAQSLAETIVPGVLIGTAVAMTDTSVFPILASLVDTRHKPVYGSVFAIGDGAFCVAFVIGPLLAGGVISQIGFPWLMRIAACIIFVFAPLVIFLRNSPVLNEESMPILFSAESDETRTPAQENNGTMTDIQEFD